MWESSVSPAENFRLWRWSSSSFQFASAAKRSCGTFSLQTSGLFILPLCAPVFLHLSLLHLFFQQPFVIADEAAGGSRCDAEFSAPSKNMIDGALDWAVIKNCLRPKTLLTRCVLYFQWGCFHSNCAKALTRSSKIKTTVIQVCFVTAADWAAVG